jgi:hypothetical protein
VTEVEWWVEIAKDHLLDSSQAVALGKGGNAHLEVIGDPSRDLAVALANQPSTPVTR